MKKITIIIFEILFALGVNAQKPKLPINAIDNWDQVLNISISNNGKYIAYEGPKYGKWVIKSVQGNQNRELSNASSVAFTNDSRYALCLVNSDSLVAINLITNDLEYLDSVVSFKIAGLRNASSIAYIKKNNQLILCDLITGKQKIWDDVKEFHFNSVGDKLVVRKQKSNTDFRELINIYDLRLHLDLNIWAGSKAGKLRFDHLGENIGFISYENDGRCCLWASQDGKKANLIIKEVGLIGKDTFYISNKEFSFSSDNTKIFFYTHKVQKSQNDIDRKFSNVIVWSSDKDFLESSKGSYDARDSDFLAVVNLSSRQVHILTKEFDRIGSFERVENDCQKYLLITHQKGNNLESNWRATTRPSLHLVSTDNGISKCILNQRVSMSSFSNVTISPKNKYVVYFNENKQHYFSYNIENGDTINISEQIPFKLYDDDASTLVAPPPYGLGIAGWIYDDLGVLIYDEFDIWLVDPLGKTTPKNLTNQYGRINNIVLRLSSSDKIRTFKFNQKTILTAFDKSNKYNGFFLLKFTKENSLLKKLSMGPYIYNLPLLSVSSFATFYYPPIKAKEKNVFVVRRMSSESAPNYFLTEDFMKFKPLTFYQPQKKYNWLTAELIKYKMNDGNLGEGILYKPQDFDSTKKYPLVFYFYERLSDQLYSFRNPEPSSILNIPNFVSNGYLVFVPDIYYKLGEPGLSVCNSVISAANFLKKNSWVDSTKLGLQGHSWGGYQVNYLITQTNMFKAAASAAGVVDLISQYGSSSTAQNIVEYGQNRIGTTLWRNLDKFIQNSPIFYADKITTPLLLMHNKADLAVPYNQGQEFFFALRRLNKMAWWLQYQNSSDHEVQGDDAKDYAIRLREFFDHYLIGKPAPEWMLGQ